MFSIVVQEMMKWSCGLGVHLVVDYLQGVPSYRSINNEQLAHVKIRKGAKLQFLGEKNSQLILVRCRHPVSEGNVIIWLPCGASDAYTLPKSLLTRSSHLTGRFSSAALNRCSMHGQITCIHQERTRAVISYFVGCLMKGRKGLE